MKTDKATINDYHTHLHRLQEKYNTSAQFCKEHKFELQFQIEMEKAAIVRDLMINFEIMFDI